MSKYTYMFNNFLERMTKSVIVGCKIWKNFRFLGFEIAFQDDSSNLYFQ